jgi:WD40 repeat protein
MARATDSAAKSTEGASVTRNSNNQLKYLTGGNVTAGHIYVVREADRELFRICAESQYGYVLTSRQMGKSSLIMHAIPRLLEAEIAAAYFVADAAGSNVTAENWLRAFFQEIVEQLGLDDSPNSWMPAEGSLNWIQRFHFFFEEFVLTRIHGRCVIFLDEVDFLGKLDFGQDILGAIRNLHNQRALHPRLAQLSFVLVGSTTPDRLIQDPERSPYDVGIAVRLDDFQETDASTLAEGLPFEFSNRNEIALEVLRATQGHPYLTVAALAAIARQGDREWPPAKVRDAVIQHFKRASGPLDDKNISYVKGMLCREEYNAWRPSGTLAMYRDLIYRRHLRDSAQDQRIQWLKLSGIVRVRGSRVVVANAVYASVFDKRWLSEVLPPSFWADLWAALRRVAPYMAALAIFLTAVLLGKVYLMDAAAQETQNRHRVELARLGGEVEQANRAKQNAVEQTTQTLQYNQRLTFARLALRAAEERWAEGSRTAAGLLAVLSNSNSPSIDARRIMQAAAQSLVRPVVVPLPWDEKDTYSFRATWDDYGSTLYVSNKLSVRAIGGLNTRNSALITDASLDIKRRLGLVAASGVFDNTKALSGTGTEWFRNSAVALVTNGKLTVGSPESRTPWWEREIDPGSGEWEWSPDGNEIAVVGKDLRVHILNAATGESLAILEHSGKGRIGSIRWSPRREWIAVSYSNGGVYLWQVPESWDDRRVPLGQSCLLSNRGFPWDIRWSPDGSRMGALLGRTRVDVWTAPWSACSRGLIEPDWSFEQTQGPTNVLAWSPDGLRVASAGPKTVYFWLLNQDLHRMVPVNQINSPSSSVEWHPDGHSTLIATKPYWSGGLYLWRWARTPKGFGFDFQLLGGSEGFNQRIAWSSFDGSIIAQASKGIGVWKLGTSMDQPQMIGDPGSLLAPREFSKSPVFASASRDSICDHRKNCIEKDRVFGFPDFSRNGRRVLTLKDDRLSVVDTATGKTLKTWSGVESSAGWGPQEEGVMFRTKEPKEAGLIALASIGPAGVAIDGRSIPDGEGLSIDWHPAQRTVALGYPNEVSVWDLDDSGWKLQHRFIAPSHPYEVRWTEDGKRLTTRDEGRTRTNSLRIYILDAAALEEAVCDSVGRNLSETEWKAAFGESEPFRKACISFPEVSK